MLALTVDVEDWYQTSDFHIPVSEWQKFEVRVDTNTLRLLDLFDEFGAKGTFFILGAVARDSPEMVKEIARRGHEIGSHGYSHQLLQNLNFSDIRQEIVDSKRLLEDLSGTAVTSFRAPSWSLGPGRYEVLHILEEAGYACDSSIQPFRTPLSGVNVEMRSPFYPVLDGVRLGILEIPSTTWKVLNWNIPFAGGLYLRTFPIQFVRWGLRQTMKQHPAMVYVHPWEIDENQPNITRSPLLRFVHYHNLARTEGKLRTLLAEFPTCPLWKIADIEEFPAYALQ